MYFEMMDNTYFEIMDDRYFEIRNRQKLETVTSFKYLGSVIIDDRSKPEILCRTAQPTAALIRLKPVLNDINISLSSKI